PTRRSSDLKCVVGDAFLPAPLTPVFASIIIDFSSIMLFLMSGASPSNTAVGKQPGLAINLVSCKSVSSHSVNPYTASFSQCLLPDSFLYHFSYVCMSFRR